MRTTWVPVPRKRGHQKLNCSPEGECSYAAHRPVKGISSSAWPVKIPSVPGPWAQPSLTPDVTASLAPASSRGNQFRPCLARDWPLGAPLVAGGLRSPQKVATVRSQFPALPRDCRGEPATLLLFCCECRRANVLDRSTGETGCQVIKTPSSSPADDGNLTPAEWARPSSPSLRGPLRGETSHRWRRHSPLLNRVGRPSRPNWPGSMGTSQRCSS